MPELQGAGLAGHDVEHLKLNLVIGVPFLIVSTLLTKKLFIRLAIFPAEVIKSFPTLIVLELPDFSTPCSFLPFSTLNQDTHNF